MIHLASQSPRRRELLAQIGVKFDVINPRVDESPLAEEAPADLVRRLAIDKARAGWRLCNDDRPALAADTIVVIDDKVLGKPADKTAALGMLGCLSGRRHEVMTAVTMATGKREVSRLSRSHVSFRHLQPAEMEAYWATGEPEDKAGGYAIQGMAALFVDYLEGSYSGVMGLPLYETAELLEEFGISVLTTDSI